MYQDFYQFTENPFNSTADPYFFYPSQSHEEALASLRYGIHERKGIMVATGDVGTGKTLLCHYLLKEANKKLKVALLFNCHFSELELLQMIAQSYKIHTRGQDKIQLVQGLQQFLLKQDRKGNNVVLIIDEAQNLSPVQLEEVRLLSNFEVEKRKLIQIVLVGLLELDKKLQDLGHLRERIGVHLHIKPLEKKDVAPYLEGRLAKVDKGTNGISKVSFTDAAIDAIFQHTQGRPRRINALCDRALLAGFVAETHLIDEYIIENCVGDLAP